MNPQSCDNIKKAHLKHYYCINLNFLISVMIPKFKAMLLASFSTVRITSELDDNVVMPIYQTKWNMEKFCKLASVLFGSVHLKVSLTSPVAFSFWSNFKLNYYRLVLLSIKN